MNKKGFTLLELMIVVAILTILAAILLGSINKNDIVKVKENAQVVIDEAKKLKEQNIDIKVTVKKPDEKKAEAPKIEVPKKDEQTKPPEGLKPL